MIIEETLAIREVEARCGRTVRAPYLDHAYFDVSSNLCLTLHYIFVRYAPAVVHMNGFRLSRAIYLFFDYLVEHLTHNPIELHPNQFTDITIEIILGYQDYLLRNKLPIAHAEKLKSALSSVAKQHGTIPLLLFPIVGRPKPKKTEPLSEGAYEALKTALVIHIDSLYEKIEFRKVVDLAPPYDYHSIPPNDPDNPVKVRSWEVDHGRSLRTLLDHGFPMSMSLDELSALMSNNGLSSYKRDCDTILKVILHKYVICSRHKGDLNLDELLGMYFPSSMDQSAIVLFLLMQSGWNKESVLGIDGTDFEHVLTGSINESLAVIFSEKYRSQGLEKPYDAPKQITASSDREDRYSIYNLILLAGKLSLPLKDFAFDTNPFLKSWDEKNELFLFLRAWGDWFKNGSRHSSISILNSYLNGVERFLKTYEVVEDGKRLLRSGDVTRRLRPTWLLHKKRTTALSIISSHFGHTTTTTTDIYYDSSGAAMQERTQRLRDELEEVVTLLVNRQFTGLLGKQANERASAVVKIFTLPGKDKPLWGCEDQLNPDWLGHETHVQPGRKCYHIEKCIGCSRVRIYDDSVPYLMERSAHIEYELELESEGPRTADLKWEKQILEYLINDCHDEETVKQAIRYRRRNAPLLPRDMSSLQLIFDDEVNDD
ncbi:hypothetical protein [Pseudomonas sp. NA-150]|uniref:hypothetical protein n=1 Tax=Pseudomonas sp. NA-150 TaxID=3367525 RepID=UPI0037C887BF